MTKLEIANSVRYGVWKSVLGSIKVEVLEVWYENGNDDNSLAFRSKKDIQGWSVGWLKDLIPICQYDYENKSVEQILNNRR